MIPPTQGRWRAVAKFAVAFNRNSPTAADGVWDVFYCRLVMGQLDERTREIRRATSLSLSYKCYPCPRTCATHVSGFLKGGTTTRGGNKGAQDLKSPLPAGSTSSSTLLPEDKRKWIGTTSFPLSIKIHSLQLLASCSKMPCRSSLVACGMWLEAISTTKSVGAT